MRMVIRKVTLESRANKNFAQLKILQVRLLGVHPPYHLPLDITNKPESRDRTINSNFKITISVKNSENENLKNPLILNYYTSRSIFEFDFTS